MQVIPASLLVPGMKVVEGKSSTLVRSRDKACTPRHVHVTTDKGKWCFHVTSEVEVTE